MAKTRCSKKDDCVGYKDGFFLSGTPRLFEDQRQSHKHVDGCNFCLKAADAKHEQALVRAKAMCEKILMELEITLKEADRKAQDAEREHELKKMKEVHRAQERQREQEIELRKIVLEEEKTKLENKKIEAGLQNGELAIQKLIKENEQLRLKIQLKELEVEKERQNSQYKTKSSSRNVKNSKNTRH